MTNRERADDFLALISAWDNLDAGLLAEALDEAERRGVARERARVVAMFRRSDNPLAVEFFKDITDAIERGDHAQNGGGDEPA